MESATWLQRMPLNGSEQQHDRCQGSKQRDAEADAGMGVVDVERFDENTGKNAATGHGGGDGR